MSLFLLLMTLYKSLVHLFVQQTNVVFTTKSSLTLVNVFVLFPGMTLKSNIYKITNDI